MFADVDAEDLIGQVWKHILYCLTIRKLVIFIAQCFPMIQGPEVSKTSEKWARPAVPCLSAEKDRLTFQQLDIDYYQDKPMKGMPGAQSGIVAIMRIFGVTREQNSICCHVHGFAPYLYVTVPDTFKVTIHCLIMIKFSIYFLFVLIA